MASSLSWSSTESSIVDKYKDLVSSNSSDDQGLAVWLIVVIVIICVLVVGAACTVIVLLLMRPRSEPKEVDLTEMFPSFGGFPTDDMDEGV